MDKGFFAFGTMNFLRIDHMDYDMAQILLQEVEDICNDMDNRFSVFKPQSDIGRINRNAGKKPVRVHPETIFVVETALKYAAMSDGAFNITIRPAMALWGFGSQDFQIPSDKEIDRIRRLIDYRSVLVNREKETIFLMHKGQELDLGGIVKGHAVDVIRDKLIQSGVTSALLNFGGTVMTIGDKPDHSPWKIGIQNPVKDRGESIGFVRLSDDALVTSGVNERYFIEDGIRYHHILDPRTLRPSTSGIMSVTVAGKKGIDLDSLATVLFLAGVEEGFKIAEQEQVEALFLTDEGQIFATKGFAEGKYKVELLQPA